VDDLRYQSKIFLQSLSEPRKTSINLADNRAEILKRDLSNTMQECNGIDVDVWWLGEGGGRRCKFSVWRRSHYAYDQQTINVCESNVASTHARTQAHRESSLAVYS